MEDPLWISFESAVATHELAIEIMGGAAGFPNPAYLESALMAPQHHLYYTDGGADLFDLAAVYLYHIARGHAFLDGNKRTAYITALSFLDLNGIDILLPANITELAEATVEASEGKLEKPALAAIMRRMPRDERSSSSKESPPPSDSK